MDEPRKVSRRLFLKDTGIAIASIGLAPVLGPAFLRSAAFAAEPARAGSMAGGKKTLICLFQRGAVDGLSMVVPHGDPHYYELRQTGGAGIAIDRTGVDGVLDLDGTFGLHPALAPLKPLYDAGHLAAIHACGSPNATRSHFDAQDYMESGMPGDKTARNGWLARLVSSCPEDRARMAQLFRAVSMTAYVPRSLQGDKDALAIPDLRTFGLAQNQQPPRRRAVRMADVPAHDGTSGETIAAAFEAMYDQDSGDIVHGTGKDTFEAMRVVRQLSRQAYAPENGAKYPAGPFGNALMQVAQLIKANVGLEVAFADVGGWDTHVRQGNSQGQLANNLRQFGQALAALYADLGDRMNDVVILTMSEFGRTARQNGNGGTDHGHATCFLALGGGVNGGKVLGKWPGLAPEQLHEGRDLEVTTDFRDVFAEVAQKHLGLRDLAAVFPNYGPAPGAFRGVMKA